MLAGYVFLGTLIACAIAGAPVLVHPRYKWLGTPARTALAFSLGLVLVGTCMTLLALARIPFTTWRIAGVTAILSALLRALVARYPLPPPLPSCPVSPLVKILAVLVSAVAIAAALLSTAATAATSPDLFLFWGPKAMQFAAARTIDSTFLSVPNLSYLHVSYPPLVTNLFAFATMAAGRFPFGAATLTFPLLLLVLASALPGVLTPSPARHGVCALVTAVIACAGSPLQLAGNADIFLLLFEVTSIGLLIGPRLRDPGVQLLAGVLLAGAVTAKVEGLPFVLLSAGAALFLVRRQRARALVRLLGPGTLALGAWFVYGGTNHLFWWYEGYGPFLEVFWHRLGMVLGAIVESLCAVSGGLPFLLPVLLLGTAFPSSRRTRLLLIIAFCMSAFVVFTFLHGRPDPRLWIVWSAGRILLPVPILLILSTLPGATMHHQTTGHARRA